MKVKYTLEKTESQNIREMLEDLPTDLCCFVDCPDGNDNHIGNPCECCPMQPIQDNWRKELKCLCEQTKEALKKIEG